MDVLSEGEKRAIAGRARTLQERLDADAGADETDGDESVDEYLDEWRDNVADGDPDAFRERLAREDLGLEECRRRIAADEWPADEPLPDWVHQLDDLLGFVRENPDVTFDFGADDEFPFVHVLSPLLEYAREEVDDVPSEYVSHSAEMDLVEWLARRVDRLWSHTLFIEFKTHVANHDPDLVFDDVEVEAGSTEYYDEFTGELLNGGLKSFFLEYSFLARLVVTVIRQWVRRVEGFYAHATSDRADLRETFGGGELLGPITEIRAVGDAHQDGRTVLGVTFESGTRVAYKPRNAGVVVGFYELVEWVNENGDLPDLRTVDFVYRDEYAWMEAIEPEACSTEAETVTYYRRAGMLTCLFYAWDATDMHLENVIAEGGHPVPVDLETLAQPNVKPANRSINETVKVVGNTVIRTGTVPRHAPSADVGDVGGFSADRAEVSMEVQQFTNVNTDRMELEKTRPPDHEGVNLPEYDGAVVGPRENTDAIVRGFREMYRFVLDNKQELLGDDGPIERLTRREARVRVLYRDTAVYSHILNATSSQSYHRTGVPFGVKVESLAKLVVTEDVDREVWPIYEAERRVLRRFNTPRFSAKLDSNDVYDLDEVVVEDFFEEKPITQIRERIESFDETDLSEQLDYVRWGYGEYETAHAGGSETQTARASPSETAPDAESTNVAAGASDGSPAFEQVAEDAAVDVFDRIVENSRTEDGSPTWILREIGPRGGVYVHQVEDRLYDGRVGIGLFAAGLAHASGDERYEDFAGDVVSPILAAMDEGEFENDPSSRRSPPRPIGGAVGLGSIVYGFTKMGELLDDERYVRAAHRTAASIGPDRISDDARYDVLNGSAGAILGLLALHAATGDGEALDRATRAGEHLLEHRVERRGVRTWQSEDLDRPLCGFSHGVAGIAYALFRLGGATGESRFAEAALEGVEYERQRYDDEAQNWPDLRAATESDWMDAWCHGRTGVGLARLGMCEVEQVPELRRDVDRALRGLDPAATTSVDHVCCGNFGRVEFLLEAGRTLGDSTYRQHAQRLAVASVRRAESAGQFDTQWQTEHWYNPSFFGGEAGIGYSLLRFVDRSLPCVLLWE